MQRHALSIVFSLISVLAFARFRCELKSIFPAADAEAKTQVEPLPLQEKLLRFTDLVLMEPGYAEARQMAATWKSYVNAFVTDERRATELEALVNEPAIVAYLK